MIWGNLNQSFTTIQDEIARKKTFKVKVKDKFLNVFFLNKWRQFDNEGVILCCQTSTTLILNIYKQTISGDLYQDRL